eukprot:CAMPEP_0174368708 /NCGR_PEP_ID=MMETSP0811_2-20130205/89874_1 /TAXON_ID=73025 ORGANISM="Eutreptiella gymnastica-like, Strain CCMP1594" /NCGR_SAMPLE_ID=MMETSP0811_2 /ASSEMBLY_ACC=CAM_ASM_000667 /LENGTH=174 /DNA_ID=CAMNT_0015512421 /DNA_START=67 /DNA_END=588 /DNA_ORIENTATION=+
MDDPAQKQYLIDHDIPELLNDLVQQLVTAQPAHPVAFLRDFLSQKLPVSGQDMASPELATLMDKMAIEELVKQYALNTDSKNCESSVEMFTDDGVLCSPAGTDQGKAQLLEHLRRVSKTVALGKRHIMTNIVPVVQGTYATCTSYMLVVDAMNRPDVILTASYQDILVKLDGAW